MIYQENVPQDTDQANQISLFIRDTKKQIRPRFEAFNGDFHAHHSVDDLDLGRHVPGRNSFTRVSTFANRFTGSQLKKGTLHYITDTPDSGIYVANDVGSSKRVNATDHTTLSGLTEGNPHPQYVYLGGSFSASTNLRIANVTTRFTYNSSEMLYPNEPINRQHEFMGWIAHGERSYAYRHGAEIGYSFHQLGFNTYVQHNHTNVTNGSITTLTFGGSGDSFQVLSSSDVVPFLLIGRIGNTHIRPYSISRTTGNAVQVELTTQSDLPNDTLSQSGTLYGSGVFQLFRYRSS